MVFVLISLRPVPYRFGRAAEGRGGGGGGLHKGAGAAAAAAQRPAQQPEGRVAAPHSFHPDPDLDLAC
jgi:hypothetical protein